MFKFYFYTFCLHLLLCYATARSIDTKKANNTVVIIDDSTEPAEDVFDQILDANKKAHMLNHLLEGDIKEDVFRNAHGNKWPKSKYGLVLIPYVISGVYNHENRSVIESAFEGFHEHTCIRFISRKSQRQYLSIEDQTGCWSYIGRTSRSQQTISLSIPTCISKGTAIHELMHAVGFRHEHSRSDRDEHIRILNENVDNSASRNFRKYLTTQNLVNYDYTSILHYSQRAFAKERYLNTIRTLPETVPQPRIGFRHQLSAYDIEEIKYHYDCGPATYARCGRDFINQDRGEFESPKHPFNYPHGSHCTWNITVRSGNYVRLTFQNIAIQDSYFCQLDYVIVHDGRNAAAPVLIRICGHRSSLEVTSSGNQMFIMFASDPNRSSTGFRATFEQVAVRRGTQLLQSPISTNLVDEFRCSFDRDLCGMILDASSKVLFELRNTSTLSEGTGPSFDHTTGTGNYIFLESSSVAYGSTGIIRTPWFHSTRYCIRFSYHMYGRRMGGLRLFAYQKRRSEEQASSQLLWERFGNQGNRWQTASYSYTPSSPFEYVQFYWKGYIPHYTSDMAIDDVEITQGFCSFGGGFRRFF